MAEKSTKQDAKGASNKKNDPNKAAKAETKRFAKNAFELVRLRNYFYRDNYRRLIAIAVFLSALTVILAAWAYYLITHKPSPRYFATNVQGGIVPLHKLNTPGLKTSYVLSWAARGATKSFTFNYVQYRQQIEEAKNIYYTPQGGEQFAQQLTDSNDLKAVVAGKFIVTAQPSAAPSLIWQGVVPTGTYKGRYGWQVDLPMVLNIQNADNVNRRNIDIKMTIVRDSYLIDYKAINLDGTKGIGIAQILVKGKGINQQQLMPATQPIPQGDVQTPTNA